jgi:hypothetical protein
LPAKNKQQPAEQGQAMAVQENVFHTLGLYWIEINILATELHGIKKLLTKKYFRVFPCASVAIN